MEKVESELYRMLADNIIKKVEISDIGSPIVVKKERWLCRDMYRFQNNVACDVSSLEMPIT